MKELFSFVSFDKDEREVINSIAAITDRLVANERRTTARQLHYSLIRENVINEKDMPFTPFYKLLKKGLCGGLVDWHGLVPGTGKCTAVYGARGLSVMEIYVRGAFLDNWISHVFRDVDTMRITHTAGLYWDINHIHNTASMAECALFDTGYYTVNYLTDYFEHSNRMFNKFNKTLRRMLQIKLAREIFNKAKHGTTWEFEGIASTASKTYNTFRRYASNALNEAKAQIEEKLSINFLGLKKGSKYAKEAHHGRLASLPINAVMAMLYSAPQRK
jgi:hypothetical protein